MTDVSAETQHHLMLPDNYWKRLEEEEAADVEPANFYFPPGDVRRYGARGDWNGSTGTDNLEAFTNAYLVALEVAARDHSAEVFIPEGKYWLSDEWDVYRINSPRRDITIRGVDQLSTILVAGFYGAGKALIRCVDPDNTDRASPTSIRDIGFENVSTSGGVNPVFIWILGHGESRLERLRFAGTNNTALRISSPQGIRGTDVVSYYGGRHFPYGNTTGLLFNVATVGNTITCTNGTPFSAADVGKRIYIFPSGDPDDRTCYTITGFTSSAIVTHSDAREHAETGASAFWEPARCSMTAASAVLTANSNCFSSDMVGLVVYVRGARAGAFGDGLLRGVITTYNAANSVTLDVTADNSVTDVYFGVACIDFGCPDGWVGSSDVKIDKLHIEHFRGLAWVSMDTDNYHLSGKIHGETTPTATIKSDAAMWLDDFGGQIDVDLDSSCSMSDTRVYACNFNDTCTFETIWSRLLDNEVIFRSEEFTGPGGYLIVRGLSVYDYAADPYNLIVDANHTADATDPRILLCGTVNMLGDTEKARNYFGRDAYMLPDGRYVFGPTAVGADYAASYSGTDGARMLFERISGRRWSIGNTTGTTTFSIRDESADAVRLEIRANTGDVIPGADNTQDLGDTSLRFKQISATSFRPGTATRIWTSGTGSPEGVLAAAVGSLYTREDGGTNTTLYVKEGGGSANTGWVAK